MHSVRVLPYALRQTSSIACNALYIDLNAGTNYIGLNIFYNEWQKGINTNLYRSDDIWLFPP